MDIDLYTTKSDADASDCKQSLPVISNVTWNENGKIVLDFSFNLRYQNKIKYYELYYCYIADIETQQNEILWARYVSNHWRAIQISSTDSYNEGIDLRIATINAMYDDTKKHNIQLFLKIRLLLSHMEWIHSVWTEFSNIFRITSILMPSVLNKATKIKDILQNIFEKNNNKNNNSKQQLCNLYNKYKYVYGVNDKFTEMLISTAKKHYKHKCNQLLSTNSLSFNQYLIKVEYYLNAEKKELFPFIQHFCTEYDLKNIIDAILSELVDCNNIKFQKLMKESQLNSNILVKMIVFDDKSVLNDINRLINVYEMISNSDTKSMFVDYICDIIKRIFNTAENVSLSDLFDRIFNFIQHKLNGDVVYHNALTYGIIYNYSQENSLKPILCIAFKHRNVEQELGKIYAMYTDKKLYDGLTRFAKTFKIFIMETAISYKTNNINKNTDIQFMSLLIRLHSTALSVVKKQFENDNKFFKSLTDSFERFIHDNNEYVGSKLAQFANYILSTQKMVSIENMDMELADIMDNVVQFYGYLRDKDVFESSYERDLSERLLKDLCVSLEAEQSMIGKLKVESGYHWASKLKEFFKDLKTSTEINEAYQEKYPNDKFEFECKICSNGKWPFRIDTRHGKNVIINKDVLDIRNGFDKFYAQSFLNRMLNYRYDFGRAQIEIYFNNKTRKILNTSTYQMIILLLFNGNNTITFGDMLNQTKIGRKELYLSVISMADPKVKILRKLPNNKQIANHHKFQINAKYNHKRKVIYIPTFKNTLDEFKQNQGDDNKDSEININDSEIDSIISNVMSLHKRLKHNELIIQLFKRLKDDFISEKIKMSYIKSRISKMIELDYLERDENNRNLYHFRRIYSPHSL